MGFHNVADILAIVTILFPISPLLQLKWEDSWVHVFKLTRTWLAWMCVFKCRLNVVFATSVAHLTESVLRMLHAVGNPTSRCLLSLLVGVSRDLS